MKRIYIADDEVDIRNLVVLFLQSEGYEVIPFETGDVLYERFQIEACDLVILDIMMPGTDGLTICNRIRQSSNVPIILLTAKDSDIDYIAGISLGSDDYLIKPFRPTLLNLRVKALLRRVDMYENSQALNQVEDKNIIGYGDLTCNKKTMEIKCKKEEIPFTSMEAGCIRILMEQGGEAVSRIELLEKVWGIACEVETRVTDETIRRVRKKLVGAGSRTSIQNKWGYGYKLIVGGDE